MRIAIVGVGHRGLAALERIVSHVGAGELRAHVTLIEPAELGTGVHRRDQPPYLTLNTVAGQVTAFSDEQMVSGTPTVPGPDFLAWCLARGITVEGADGGARPVAYADFVPRRLLGDYLTWAADRLLADLPAGLEVEVRRTRALDVRPNGARAAVALADGAEIAVDLALITTGHDLHGELPPDGRGPGACYPLPDRVATIPAGARVAVAGMGLTAVDVVAALTVGRGGRFARKGGRLAYRAGGEEPHIVLFSRSGWLPCARPSNPRRGAAPPARALTAEAVAALRARRSDRRLAFEGDVMPLIASEILEDASLEVRRAAERLLGVAETRWADRDEYETAVAEQARWDLAQAALGLGVSAFKERMEALRDHRALLRAVVDAPGLTREGHRAFFATVPALANRLAVGPEQQSAAELIALIDAGVVSLGPGPAPRVAGHARGGWMLSSTRLRRRCCATVDLMVHAHLGGQARPGGELGRSTRRWARAHPHDPTCLDLTREGHVRRKDGATCRAVALIGPPAEGANYYNNYLLWPGVQSRALNDLDRVLEPLLDRRGSTAVPF